MLIHFFISFVPIIYIIFSDLQTLRWISKIYITQWQSTYGYLGSYLGWDPSAYQYGMLTYENVSVDSKESSAGIFPLTQNLNTKSNNLYLLFFSKFWIFFTLPHGKELWKFFFRNFWKFMLFSEKHSPESQQSNGKNCFWKFEVFTLENLKFRKIFYHLLTS